MSGHIPGISPDHEPTPGLPMTPEGLRVAAANVRSVQAREAMLLAARLMEERDEARGHIPDNSTS